MSLWMGAATCWLIACGGDDEEEPPPENNVIQDAGTDAAIPDLDPAFVPTGDAGVLSIDSAFEGIATDAVPYGLAPQGCDGGFSAGRIELVLGGGVSQVHIGVVGGEVQANGVTCDAEDGSPATAADTSSIAIFGGVEDNHVILDLSLGAFGDKLLSASLPIGIDLGDGWDGVSIIGTHGADAIRLGSAAGPTVVRFADAGSQLGINNTEQLIVSTGPGNDTISGGGGEGVGDPTQLWLRFYGGDGADNLEGGAGADGLIGGAGDDLFLTAANADGGDVYDGGEGDDHLSYALRTSPVSVTLGVGADDGATDEGDDVMLSIENVTGGFADDSLVGSEADNVIMGGPGNDLLHGGPGDDRFVEAGVAEGADTVYGGSGNDSMDYSGRVNSIRFTACAPDPEDCAEGACGCSNDSGEAGELDTLVGVESVAGGSANDQLYGNAQENWLYANEGDDELFGAGGEDALFGGEGTDVVDGGDGQGDICVVDESDQAVNCELGAPDP